MALKRHDGNYEFAKFRGQIALEAPERGGAKRQTCGEKKNEILGISTKLRK
jgi:hypothetical protein